MSWGSRAATLLGPPSRRSCAGRASSPGKRRRACLPSATIPAPPSSSARRAAYYARRRRDFCCMSATSSPLHASVFCSVGKRLTGTGNRLLPPRPRSPSERRCPPPRERRYPPHLPCAGMWCCFPPFWPAPCHWQPCRRFRALSSRDFASSAAGSPLWLASRPRPGPSPPRPFSSAGAD